MNDDMELLRQFAIHQSENAFAALVSRHTNLVFSVALRRVRDPQLAEEITQAVFVILARKAATLNQSTILPGWLYRAACFTSNSALKAEYRRQKYEQEAHMQSTIDETGADAVWQQMSPLLEEAMLRLSQSDRDALVLRFFEGRTLREVGAAMSASEEAAKKRVNRALDKLHLYFSKRGVVSTTAMLAQAMTLNSVQAAPVTLAKSVIAMAMTQSTTANASTSTLIKGALKIMAWTKAKMVITAGAVVLLAAGTTTVTVKAIARHREDGVWSQITRIDSRQLEAAPPIVSIRPAPFDPMRGGTVWVNPGKRMGFAASVATLLSDAYDISEERIADTAVLPKDKYDFIVSLPDHQSAALQGEIKNKLGLAAIREMRDTDVLLLKVARPNAPGLEPTPPGAAGSNFRTMAGELICNNQAIDNLRSFLESHLKIPVIDQTGLTGHYNIDLTWSEPGGFQNPNAEALKQAVLDKLGLELTPASQSIEMLVVEKVK
jgi:uncharacterized protein (TIGR03435 family)